MSGTQQLLLAEGGGGAASTYIEDVFSTYLYTGTGAALTITNNIDLSTKGGMVWLKKRSATGDNVLFDTVRGATNRLWSNLTLAQAADAQSLTAFNTDGFSLGTDSTTNGSAATLASWTFRKQPKFFDVVTYTGNGVGSRTVSHNLGSVPGCIIIKRTDSTSNWGVMCRQDGGAPDTYFTGLYLNGTAASTSVYSYASSNTSTVFPTNIDPDSGSTTYNVNGATYVAYVFANNAGGFGLTGTDNVISCGSFTTDGSGLATVNLGYEPQYLLLKDTTNAGSWFIRDTMRGLNQTGYAFLQAQSSAAESSGSGSYITPTATGFTTPTAGAFTGSATYIYIAIRRGPMKVPTDGTKVFIPVANTVSADNTVATTNFPVDLVISKAKTVLERWWWFDKLRGTRATGPSYNLSSNAAYAEGTISSNGYGLDSNTTFVDNFQYFWNGTSRTFINYALRRAPSFFDEVCYTGTGSATTVTHNLQAVPELIIVKDRTAGNSWAVGTPSIGWTNYLTLNTQNEARSATSIFNDTAPTSSVFSVGTSGYVNQSTYKYVAYLFATCAGVSKVGSYTGNNSSQTINCGFSGGARFVLIKRVDTTGPWMVWDTARGMVAGTDYNMFFNTDDAQENSNNVYTATTGFQVIAFGSQDVNLTGGTYIYLAIA